jgi:hypothetical protein
MTTDSRTNYDRTLQTFARGALMTGAITAEDVRRRLWLHLSPAFAADAGLTLEDLRQFIAGTRTLPRDTLAKLAGRMGLT